MSDRMDTETRAAEAPGRKRLEVAAYVGIIATTCIGLYLSSLYSYLLFHGLVEIATIAVGFMLFVLVWNTQRFCSNGFLSILGIGYAFIALIDLVHTLAYRGMNVFAGFDSNLPTQLWISARYLQAFTILAALLFVNRKADNRIVFGVYAVLVSATTVLVFSGHFPAAYVEGSGLTPFKIYSEYVITALLLVALYLFYRQRRHFDSTVFRLVAASILCTALSEVSFTAYVSVYGSANFLGHLLKLVAFYLVYRAILVTGFKTPFELIFRELGQAYDDLRAANEHLAQEVDQRTAAENELRRARDELELRVRERTRALRVLSESNQALMHATNEHQLLDDVCRIVVEIGGYTLCWVGFVEHDEEKSLRPVASAGSQADYVEHIRVSWGTGPTGQGPSGRSIREKTPVAVRDMQADPGYAPWADEALRRGFRSSISLPLIDSNGEVFGALAIYSDRPRSFDAEEIDLLAELAGDLAFGIGTVRERQARAQAEAEVREAARYTRTVIEASLDPIAVVDLEGTITDVNQAAEQILGVSRGQLIGSDFSSPFTQPELAQEGMRKVLEDGSARNFPLAITGPSGETLDLLLSGTVYRDEAGEVQGILTIARDVTEWKRAQAQLARLASIVTSSQDAILTIELDGTITSWNSAAEALYGYSADEMIGANIGVLAPPDRPDEPRLLVEQILEGGRVSGVETMRMRKDGSLIDISLTLSAIRDDAGGVVAVSAIGHDITERKKAEQLVVAKQAAEAASVAKSAFLANMSHEIRTPMNAILGFSQLMRHDAGLTERQRKQLDIINSSGEHLLALINDVLEMSKIEAGRISANLAAFDLHALIDELESLFALRAEAKGLALCVERSDDVPQFVATDEAKLRQVLVNLLSNAVKFTDEGKIELRMDARRDADDVLRLLVEVEDTGRGIAHEDTGRLFHYFEQASTPPGIESGTGLGLAISREFVHLLGGEISVDSEPGVGSTFRFDIAITESSRGALAGGAEERRVAHLAPDQPQYRVLVADDASDNRELLVELLAPVGFDVRSVATGTEALEVFDSWAPHLVLMDMRMPVMDGYEATRRIRATEGERHTAIIGVTASAFAEMREAVFDAGVDELVPKPFRESEILGAIGRVLGVRYVYEEEEGREHAPAEALDPKAIAALPSEVRDGLERAAVDGDFEEVLSVADEIEPDDERTAASLRLLAERFDSGPILDALRLGAPE